MKMSKLGIEVKRKSLILAWVGQVCEMFFANPLFRGVVPH